MISEHSKLTMYPIHIAAAIRNPLSLPLSTSLPLPKLAPLLQSEKHDTNNQQSDIEKK
jgi:hypothetical protein